MDRTIQQIIKDLGVHNCYGQRFVPITHLTNALSEDVVKDTLRQCGLQIYQREEALRGILRGGTRVFAILCTIGKEKLIMEFLKYDNFLDVELDSKLPFEEIALRFIIPDDYRQFYDIQWEFSAPVLKPNLYHRTLHDRCILPFIKVRQAGEGGFGTVSRVTLPGSHQGISQGELTEVEVIRKELKLYGTRGEDYEHEQHILSLLRCLKHPNIVQFYTAYTLKTVPTLIFAPADHNLAEFLSHPCPPQFQTDEAIFQALYSLSSAISHVHNYFSEEYNLKLTGCHFDLKPKNILVKKDQFILADFGLSRLKAEIDGSQSGFKVGFGDYLAPECQDLDGEFEKYRIGRSSDIWSFGCILAEIATFICLGTQGVTDFAEKRKIKLQGFLTIRPFHASNKPHALVKIHLDGLCNQQPRTGPRLGLLALTRKMLEFQADDRPDALQVSTQLFILAQRTTFDVASKSFTVLQEKGEFGSRVECERFKIWGACVGLSDVSEDSQASTWFHEEGARSHFDTVRSVLQDIVRELSLQSDFLRMDPVEPCNTPTHYALRRLVDTLWDMHSTLIIRKMNNTLEARLLGGDIPDPLFHFTETEHDKMGYRRLQLLVAMRQAMASVDEYMNKSPRFLVDESSFKRTGEVSGRRLGYITTDSRKRFVLMEILEYQDKWTDRFDELLLRVDGLVSLLSTPEITHSFPMLPCQAFCHLLGDQAFGLLYDLPFSNTNPITLVDLIKQTQPRASRPLLEDVYAIAYSLASSVLEFHKAGWLHKSISPFNLLFILGQPEPVPGSISPPYLIGFNHSRQSNEFAFTEGPCDDVDVRDYHHPEYREGGIKRRFQEHFDYYSVGIVLLELGLWKPLRKLIRGKDTCTPRQIRDYLLEESVPLLGSYMGGIYRDTVVACMSGNAPQEREQGSPAAWVAFEATVVGPLLQCLAIKPDNVSTNLSTSRIG